MTRDPEAKYTANGVAITTLSIAVNRFTKDENTGEYGVDFFDIVAWRRTAEFIGQYGAKGRLISVEGRIVCRKWKTDDGQPRKTYEIHATNIQTLDKPRDATEATGEFKPTPGNEGNDPFADD